MTTLHRHIFGPHVVGPYGFAFAPHVGEFFVRGRVDGSQMKGDTVQALAEAGDAGGKTFGERFKAQFTKANLGKGIAQGLGFGVGLGTVGLVARGVQALTDTVEGAVNAAIGWESAMAGVAKTLDTTGLSAEQADDALAGIEQGLRDMAKEIPVPVEQLAALAEAGGALGIAREDLLAFTETAALLGATTDLAAEDAATALGKINAVLPLTREEYSRTAATIVDLGNKGASTESEIVSMAQNMAGSAALIGLSKQALFGWASALANAGEEAEAGSSSFSRFAQTVNQAVATAGPKLLEIADLAGMTGDQFAELWDRDANEALRRVVNGLGDLDKNARQAALASLGFTDIRITRALLALTANTDNLNGALEVSEQAWKDNTAAAAEAEKRFQTTESKVAILNNALHDAGIDFGERIIDAGYTVVQVLAGIGEAVHDIERFFDQDMAAMEDTLKGLDDVEKKWGIAADAGKAYYLAQSAVFEQMRKERETLADWQELLGMVVTWQPTGTAKNATVADYLSQVEDLARRAGLTMEELYDATKVAFQDVDSPEEFAERIAGLNAELENTPEAIAATEREMRALPVALAGLRKRLAEEIVAGSQQFWTAGQAMGEKAAEGMVQGITTAAGESAPEVAFDLAASLAAAREDAAQKSAWREAGIGFVFDLMGGIREGVKDSRTELQGTTLELRAALTFDWAAEAGYAVGGQFGRQVAKGLADSEPENVEKAKGLALAGLEAIAKGGSEGPRAANRIGELLGGLYAAGLSRTEVEARLAGEGVNLASLERIAEKKGWHLAGEGAAQRWVKGVEDQTEDAATAGEDLNDAAQTPAADRTGWYTAGWTLGGLWRDGLYAAIQAAGDGMPEQLVNVTAYLWTHSPPEKGPLRDIEHQGRRLGEMWAGSFLGGLTLDGAALSGALPSGIGLDPLGIRASITGGIGPIGVSVGEQTVRHVVELAPGTVRQVLDAGGSMDDIASIVRAAGESADIRYTRPRRV